MWRATMQRALAPAINCSKPTVSVASGEGPWR